MAIFFTDSASIDDLSITGSLRISGSIMGNLTGTASYATNALSSSYAATASLLLGSVVSSSYAATASIATSASYALSASFAPTNTTGSFTGSFSGSLLGTASYATNALSASYALNGGVTQLLAGPNIVLSPTNGLGQVTITANLSGSTSFNTSTGSYGSFYDTTTQTNPVANIPRSMSFNNTDITNGVSISGSTSPFNTYIKTQNAGVYNIQFSAQIDKTDGGNDEVVIWLRKNGIDLTDTATTLTLQNNNDKQIAAWNWFVTSAANDYYQIIWLSADVDLRLLAEPISGTHPGIPSVISTVNRVDQFLSNTGSFSGSFNGNFTGSLLGTASNAVSSSYTLTASIATSASYAATASYVVNALTASYIVTAQTASYVLNAVSSSFASTASLAPDYTTLTSFNSFTGSFRTGSFTGSFTGSLLGTASYATNALSSSYAATASVLLGSVVSSSYALSSSFALTASFALNGGGGNINTGSFVTTSSFNTFTSSYTTGSFTGSFTGSLLGTASYANNALSSSFAATASLLLGSVVSASYALSSSYSLTASFALNGGVTTNPITFNDSGSGDAPGTSFNGSTSRTISYNTLGANKVITSGTAAPSGGVDGDIYLQYV
jgi:hypothetical protein